MTCNLISDPPQCQLWAPVQMTYAAAHAPSTALNLSRQDTAYVSVMLASNFDPLHPTQVAALIYIQWLANSLKDVRSVRNYVSGAKTFIVGAGGTSDALTSPMTCIFLKGVARRATHIPAPAPPIPRRLLLDMCDVMQGAGPDGKIARAAVLFGIASLLGQSNFLPQSLAGHGPHLVKRGDISADGVGFRINVASSKTISTPGDGVVLAVRPAPGSRYCPVDACRRAWRMVPEALMTHFFCLNLQTFPSLSAAMRASLAVLGDGP